MKLVIIGGGSSYTPELVGSVEKFYKELPITEICLTDINANRLEILRGLSERMIKHSGLPIKVTGTLNQKKALEGASFINCLIRVGGMAARINDERIPLKFGVVGQETTGPGGMMKALRTIPVILKLAQDIQEICPDAWLINYTNPSGIIAEALGKHSKVNWVGLCSGPNEWIKSVLTAMGVKPERSNVSWLGLNHLGFITKVLVDGEDATARAIESVAQNWPINQKWLQTLGYIPASYLRYYYHRIQFVNEATQPGYQTRGEQVLEIEKELLRLYADPQLKQKPPLLAKRGGGGYADSAFAAMIAIHQNSGERQILQVLNKGAIDGLPEDASVEIACLLDRSGPQPIRVGEIPLPLRGLVQSVKSYESLTVQAATTESKRVALQALMAHPLVPGWEVAEPLLEELLKVNSQWINWA